MAKKVMEKFRNKSRQSGGHFFGKILLAAACLTIEKTNALTPF